MTHCGGPECDGEQTCTCDCERCGITQVADEGIVIDHVVPEAARSTVRLRAHVMDAPDGPICACGRPSAHESSWCGACEIVPRP